MDRGKPVEVIDQHHSGYEVPVRPKVMYYQDTVSVDYWLKDVAGLLQEDLVECIHIRVMSIRHYSLCPAIIFLELRKWRLPVIHALDGGQKTITSNSLLLRISEKYRGENMDRPFYFAF